MHLQGLGREDTGHMSQFAAQNNAGTWDFKVYGLSSVLECIFILHARLAVLPMYLHPMMGQVLCS